MDEPNVWVPFAAALAGAAVGGLATFIGSIVVDRRRLKREMRVRNYDEHIPEAAAAVTRWHERSKRRGIDLENEEALSALAQVRRAANVAGRWDRNRVKAWDDSYRALQALSAQIRYASDGKGSWSVENSKQIAEQAEQHTSTVVDSLDDFADWLEKRIT